MTNSSFLLNSSFSQGSLRVINSCSLNRIGFDYLKLVLFKILTIAMKRLLCTLVFLSLTVSVLGGCLPGENAEAVRLVD